MNRKELIDYVTPLSFLDRPRLESLWDRAESVIDVEGNIVECGCGRGGSAGLLAGLLGYHNSNKRLIVCDTFEGLPPPERGVDEAEGWDWPTIKCIQGSAKGTVKEIADLCRRTGPGVTVNCVKGLYADTLPILGCGPIALLHADADWYYSTKQILDNLYPLVSPGGIVIFDDYHFWSGCGKAVREYFDARAPWPRMHTVSVSAWLRKPADAPFWAKIPPSTPMP